MTHRLDKLSGFMKRCDLITGKLHVKFAIFLYSYFILFFCGIPWNNFITVHVYFPNTVNVYGTENVEPRICETSKREFTKEWNYFRRNIITKYRFTYFSLTFRSVNILFGILHLKIGLCCNSAEKVEAKHRRSTYSFKHRFQLHESNPTYYQAPIFFS